MPRREEIVLTCSQCGKVLRWQDEMHLGGGPDQGWLVLTKSSPYTMDTQWDFCTDACLAEHVAGTPAHKRGAP